MKIAYFECAFLVYLRLLLSARLGAADAHGPPARRHQQVGLRAAELAGRRKPAGSAGFLRPADSPQAAAARRRSAGRRKPAGSAGSVRPAEHLRARRCSAGLQDWVS